jgi:hypothetical protein
LPNNFGIGMVDDLPIMSIFQGSAKKEYEFESNGLLVSFLLVK